MYNYIYMIVYVRLWLISGGIGGGRGTQVMVSYVCIHVYICRIYMRVIIAAYIIYTYCIMLRTYYNDEVVS